MKNYRHPKTTQEKRFNQERGSNGWGRAARNMVNLPDAYDDYYIRRPKCWKNKRKKQYNIVNITE